MTDALTEQCIRRRGARGGPARSRFAADARTFGTSHVKSLVGITAVTGMIDVAGFTVSMEIRPNSNVNAI